MTLAALPHNIRLRGPEGNETLFQPDHVMPAQFFTPASGPLTPERRLLLALLEDALQCLAEGWRSRRSAARRRANDALIWFLSEEMSYPFAFPNVCAYLGLNAAAIRGVVRARYGALPVAPPRLRTRPRPVATLRGVRVLREGGRFLIIALDDGRTIHVPTVDIRQSNTAWRVGDEGDLVVSRRWARRHGLCTEET